MTIKQILNIFKNNQSGSVLVLVALFMTIIIGMSALVLDKGVFFNTKSELQKAVDSTALAAVRELPITKQKDWDKVIIIANEYAKLNGIAEGLESDEIIPLDVNRNPITGGINNTNAEKINGIQILKDAVVNYNFASILGLNQGDVSVDATAELVPVEGVRGLLPIAISQTAVDYLYDHPEEEKIIKFDGQDNKELGLPGWRGAVNFSNEEGDFVNDGMYQNSIEYGYDSVVAVDDYVKLNSGTMNISTLPDTYSGHENCIYVDGAIYKGPLTYNEVGEITSIKCTDCPRLAIIPIITFEPTYIDDVMVDVANKLVRVVGFATIWIENVTPQEISASIISDDVVVNGARTGYVENDYGVRAAKLVD